MNEKNECNERRQKAQTAAEYLLLIGGAILLVVIVMLLVRTGPVGAITNSTNASTSTFFGLLSPTPRPS
jgi:uncharacterized protein (UPF0333 family)